VAWLEVLYPNRVEWAPTRDDIRTDTTFLVAVQLALPPVAGYVFTSMLVEPARSLGLPLAAAWPARWPVAAQAALMILLVDLMRYWLHRLAHETPLLWRLHAVHHSVDRLYWLNTTRFHPLEKFLQMCLDSLPFLLMGVEPAVLSIYYVAYSTNGFFQHGNIAARYGVLNYVVSSAEAHRWHHSREPREGNSNYGSTTIVWDILFGTWYLPPARTVAAVGLHDRTFPRTFWGQMRVPFSRR
jgi:sterol desaturase/sphingolipid hydroxylase (fatty acid hydroxylase superfamily)